MRKKDYFEKNGFVYGVEYKMMYGHWCVTIRKFTDYNEAFKWLTADYGEFVVTRELACKSVVRKLRKNALVKELVEEE